MRVLTVGGILVFAVLAAFLLTHAVGQRRPGGEITGNAQAGGTTTTVSQAAALAAAKAAATAQPKSYAAHIAYARTLAAGTTPRDAIKSLSGPRRSSTRRSPSRRLHGLVAALLAHQVNASKTRTPLLDAAPSASTR